MLMRVGAKVKTRDYQQGSYYEGEEARVAGEKVLGWPVDRELGEESAECEISAECFCRSQR